MDYLLSGLLGALFATFFSVAYFHISSQSKLRSEVALEVISFCDDIYSHLITLTYYRNNKFNNREIILKKEDYYAISKELTAILISSKTQAKVAIVYGEKELLATFMDLSFRFRDAASILRKATPSGWVVEKKQLTDIFDNKIEPIRRKLEIELIRSTRLKHILLSEIPTLRRIIDQWNPYRRDEKHDDNNKGKEV